MLLRRAGVGIPVTGLIALQGPQLLLQAKSSLLPFNFLLTLLELVFELPDAGAHHKWLFLQRPVSCLWFSLYGQHVL
jgi:hypothetical protein